MKIEPTGFRVTPEEGGPTHVYTVEQAMALHAALTIWLPSPEEHDEPLLTDETPPEPQYIKQALVSPPPVDMGDTQRMPEL